MKDELEALRVEVAKLRDEIAALRSERVVIVAAPAPASPTPPWPTYQNPALPSPVIPYSLPVFYSTCTDTKPVPRNGSGWMG